LEIPKIVLTVEKPGRMTTPHHPLPLIPSFAATVVGATTPFPVFTLSAFRFIGFAAMMLIPPGSMRIAAGLNKTASGCQNA
jgi:hypothetical protein